MDIGFGARVPLGDLKDAANSLRKETRILKEKAVSGTPVEPWDLANMIDGVATVVGYLVDRILALEEVNKKREDDGK